MANQRDFNDFVDTIIAEAAGEGRKGMIAVASVINNRATVRGQTVGQVVRAPNQFDGYSKPGSSAKKAQQNAKMRAEAEKIARDVMAGKIEDPTGGADHFYSGANKPGWANKLAKTVDIGGHKFHQSPQAASKLGNAVRQVANTVGNVADAVTAPVRQVAAGVGNMASALRTAAFPSFSAPISPSRPTVDVPGGYDLPSRPIADVGYRMGSKRPNPPSLDLVSRVQNAATDVLGPNVRVDIVSGQGQYGSSRHRDPNGIAADVKIFDKATGQYVTNQKSMMDVAQAFAAQGGKGIGYGPEYMGNATMHLDTVTPGPGQDYEWGSLGNRNAGSLADARKSALMPASFYDRNLPKSMPAPPSRPSASGTMMAAPVGKVERAPLQAAAPRAPDPARFAYDTPNPARFGPRTPSTTAKTSRLPSTPDAVAAIDYSETPEWARRNPFANAVVKAYEYLSPAAQAATRPNKPSLSPAALGRGSVTAPSFASARMVAPAMDLPSQSFARAPSLTPAALGRGTVTAPSFNSARMMAPATVAPTQRFSQPVEPAPVGSMNNVPRGNLQPPAPNANMSLAAQYASYGAGRVPNPTPALNAMMSPNVGPLTQTSLMPPNTVVPGFVPATPAPAPITTPTMPRLPSPINQRINQAVNAPPPSVPQYTAADVYAGRANSGVATGGNTVSRDQWGNTSVTNKYGVTTTTGPNGQQMASSSPGIAGPLGNNSIPTTPQAPSNLGSKVRGGLGTVVGGGLGGFLAGPIGAALGAVVAGDLAKGKNPLDRLGLGTFDMPVMDQFGFTQQMRFANPQKGGAFPNAPSGGFRDPTFSNRSDREMRDISPNAARDIRSGTAGLF